MGVSQDGVGVAVDDNGGVCPVARKSHAEPPRVGGEMRGFTIAGERVDDHDGLAFEPLGLVCGADQHTGQIGQPGGYGAGLLNMRSDDRDIVRLEKPLVSVTVHQSTGEKLSNAGRRGRGEAWIARTGQRCHRPDGEFRQRRTVELDMARRPGRDEWQVGVERRLDQGSCLWTQPPAGGKAQPCDCLG